jgi:hypothetical protein
MFEKNEKLTIPEGNDEQNVDRQGKNEKNEEIPFSEIGGNEKLKKCGKKNEKS